VLKISESTLDAAELVAIEQVTSYLRTRFDMVATFSAVGTDRNPLIIMYMIDLILYHLHSNTPGRVVPKVRGDRFDAAITWLEKVNDSKLEPTLPPLLTATPDPLFRFGSKRKVTHRW
jgi:hypothetical protein